jgi:hypothetical protein
MFVVAILLPQPAAAIARALIHPEDRIPIGSAYTAPYCIASAVSTLEARPSPTPKRSQRPITSPRAQATDNPKQKLSFRCVSELEPSYPSRDCNSLIWSHIRRAIGSATYKVEAGSVPRVER